MFICIVVFIKTHTRIIYDNVYITICNSYYMPYIRKYVYVLIFYGKFKKRNHI